MLMFVSVRFHRAFAVFLLALSGILLLAGLWKVTATAIGKADESSRGVRLPIIMYHSLLQETKRQGKFVVSPNLFEGDLRYLKEKGYQEIQMKDLLNYVDAGVSLPQKPVMITFDDGYYNNYLYAYPLLQKYGAKAVISPIGYYTDQFSQKDADHANYSHLTWGEIDEMVESGLVEIENHTYNLHSDKGRLGAKKLPGESVLKYQSLLRADVGKMQGELMEHTGMAPSTFVYPYGVVSPESIPVLKSMGFRSSMTCESRMNDITDDPDSLYGLGRFLRPSRTSSAVYFSRIGIN